ETSNERNSTTNKTLELQPLECKQIVTGLVLDKITKLPIANTSVSILENNSEIAKKTTDVQGKFSFDITCEKTYKIVASNKVYSSETVEFETSNERNSTTNKTLELQPLECKQIVTGLVLDKITKLPIANTSVAILENNSEIAKKTTDVQGKFSFDITCEKAYKIVASNKEYTSEVVEFNTSKERDAITNKTLELTPLECKQIVTGLVLDKITKLPIANTSVAILENNSEIAKKTTDVQGKFSFDITCEKAYKIVASNKVYSSKTVEFNTSKERDLSTNKTLELTPLECKQIVTGLVLDKITKLPIANTSVSILENNSEIAKKTTDVQGKFSFDITCEKAYKIVVSNKEYTSEVVEFETSKERDAITNKTFELEPSECNQTVTGIIRDKITKKPLPNTTINLYKDNELINSFTVGDDGVYEFPLKCETSYKITVFKNNSLDAFRLKTAIENGRTLTLNIDIEPLICVQYINGVLKESISENAIPNATITLFNYNKEIAKTETDSNGSFYFEIECSKAYTISAQKDNYTTVNTQLFSSEKTAVSNSVSLTLEPLIPFTEKKGIKYIETKPLNFILDEFEINNDVKLELNKVVYNMNQNPNVKIEINYHTDSRGPDTYNLQLTKNRANSTKDYLISKGINSNRIEANGYGETKLLNNCSNNVKCSEEEHSVNRRTEFKVISN
ncbi:MAG: carboxypeptidase regulatory-like domain-containing protein, partial [Lutibacter sp.]|nr:carboxypeptidase regulatory-like domain-containing protein [Lutibacter sp.]